MTPEEFLETVKTALPDYEWTVDEDGDVKAFVVDKTRAVMFSQIERSTETFIVGGYIIGSSDFSINPQDLGKLAEKNLTLTVHRDSFCCHRKIDGPENIAGFYEEMTTLYDEIWPPHAHKQPTIEEIMENLIGEL